MESPVMICVYGKPKRGKTSDALAAFPNALFIGVPSAISLVAQNELGFTPALHTHPPQTLDALVQVLKELHESGAAKNYGAIVIDDASHICRQSMLFWQANAPRGRSGKPDRFYQYQQLNVHLLTLSSMSRHLGCHLLMTFHERAPGHNADGAFCPGGPDVPSRNQVEMLPSWCDMSLRTLIDPTYPDPWFQAIYSCNPSDPDWITGDRTGVCSSRTPANIREILRASQSGYELSRLAGLEWQEDVANRVANGLQDGEDLRGLLQQIAAGRSGDPRHLRWACQDGIARGVLSRRLNRGLFDFTLEESSSKPGGNLPPPPPTP